MQAGPISTGTADAALDQADPAQDQRAHDALAEIGFGDQQRAQFLRRDQQRLDLAFGMAVDQRDAAGELADLGQELARPLIDHRRDMAEPVALGDRDMPDSTTNMPGPGLPVSNSVSPCLIGAQLAEAAHAVDFMRESASERSARGAETQTTCAALGELAAVPSAAMLLLAPERTTGQEIEPAATGPALFRSRHLVRHPRRPEDGGRGIAAPARLRFPPLEIFAQRQLQPVLSRIPRADADLPFPLVLIVLHAGPFECREVRG